MNQNKIFHRNEELRIALSKIKRNVDIIIHPSKLPSSLEYTYNFTNGLILNAAAVENDIQSTLTTPAVTRLEYIDTFNYWNNSKSIKDFERVFSKKRFQEFFIRSSSNNTKDYLKLEMLTIDELKQLAELGRQEVLSFPEYLELYKKIRLFNPDAPKLAIDIHKPYLSESVFKELESEGLSDRIYIIMERNLESLSSINKFLSKKGKNTNIGFVPESNILEYEGVDAFKNCIRSAVVNYEIKTFSIKLSELDNVVDELKKTRLKSYSLIVYVPRTENDINFLISKIHSNNNIKAYQVDSK
ncbi:MAG: hypothetical protein ACP5M9_03595 [Candidatus Micrarchaeia archaeon]